ncbi:hypothetical protein [Streptacidiphilus neutrinimicus]|uniref:hypothetical protein n=1 Tax=Streptacidiphilus neutrinimicus TaxID=105420 RepID=UPI0005A8D628|nr:hypothetical protein [Streptacidiphilus neutrinimicus]
MTQATSADALWRPAIEGLPGLGSLTSYTVHAQDGRLGRVLRTEGSQAGFVIVNTGPWFFGRLLAVPAGLVSRVDQERKHVELAGSKAQIKQAPEYRGAQGQAYEDYRTEVSDYYDQTRGNRLAG